MKFENIIFDLDGTLIDSFPGIQFSAQEAVQSVLPGWKLPELRSMIGPPIRQIFQRAFPDLAAQTLQALESQFRRSYDREGYRKGEIYEGVRETLDILNQKGITLFLVTNKPIAATQQILSLAAILVYFRGVLSPDIFQPPFGNKGEMAAYLLRTFRLNPEHTLLVGDSVDDREAARDCGFWFGAVTYGYGKVHLHPPASRDLVLSGFADLLPMIVPN